MIENMSQLRHNEKVRVGIEDNRDNQGKNLPLEPIIILGNFNDFETERFTVELNLVTTLTRGKNISDKYNK